jgi:hypothetical protein
VRASQVAGSVIPLQGSGWHGIASHAGIACPAWMHSEKTSLPQTGQVAATHPGMALHVAASCAAEQGLAQLQKSKCVPGG